MRPPRWVFPGAAVFILSACALVQSPTERARDMAATSGMRELELPDRRMRGFIRVAQGQPVADLLTVYVESDGAPWRTQDEPPSDPTPVRHLVLAMAIVDPSPSVAYLGRPCQYLDDTSLSECDPALWMRGRFRPDAVDIMTRAVDALKHESGALRVNLVGYSGGGAMAALIASGRDDVVCLVTIAAPLDTQAWTAALAVSPLSTSMNPLDHSDRLRGIPQSHFRGMRDRVVPPVTTAKFIERAPRGSLQDQETFDHECCWAEQWPELRRLSCLVQ